MSSLLLPTYRKLAPVAILGFASSAVALGCGGKVVFDETTKGEASGVGGASSSASITVASASSTASTSMGAGGSSIRLLVNIEYSGSGFVGVSCEPTSSPVDPVAFNVGAVLSNSGVSPESATFPAAHVFFTKGSQALAWTLGVTPTDSGPIAPNAPSVTEPMWETPNSGSGEGMGSPCDYCGGELVFKLDVSTPGQDYAITTPPMPVECGL